MAIGYGNHEAPPASAEPKPADAQRRPATPGAPGDEVGRGGKPPGDMAGSTPGAGTLPTNPQGDEVDPGAG